MSPPTLINLSTLLSEWPACGCELMLRRRPPNSSSTFQKGRRKALVEFALWHGDWWWEDVKRMVGCAASKRALNQATKEVARYMRLSNGARNMVVIRQWFAQGRLRTWFCSSVYQRKYISSMCSQEWRINYNLDVKMFVLRMNKVMQGKPKGTSRPSKIHTRSDECYQ
jgi:hypothetical protein